MMRTPSGCRLGAAAALALLGAVASAAVAGPAAAMPFEGDPGRDQCVRIVHRQTLWPTEVGTAGFVGLPYVAVLVHRSEC
jgi:hypothetical protein